MIGLGIAAAIGPISLLVIHRTLAASLVVGLASGLGVAVADATYGAVAAFGVTAVTDALVGLRRPLAILGGVFLVVLGQRAMLRGGPAGMAPPDAPARRPDSAATVSAFASILGLTLSNPMTILSFAAVFASAGLGGAGVVAAASATAGIFLGSFAWWVALAIFVSRARSRVSDRGLRRIGRVSGLLMIVIGAVAVVSGVLRG